MLLRKYTCVRLFAASLAIAIEGQQRESSETWMGTLSLAGDQEGINREGQQHGSIETWPGTMPHAGNQNQWQSRDCIEKPLRDIAKTNTQNKSPACIRWCKETKGEYKFAAINKKKCSCGNEASICGGSHRWWNVFSTDGKIFNCQLHLGLIFSLPIRCSGKVCGQFTT